MSASRESWARIGGVIGIACGFAGFCFGLLHAILPNGGFVRDLFLVAAVCGAAVICSLAFDKDARAGYLKNVGIACIVLFYFVCALKLELKDYVAAGFSAIVPSINNLAEPREPDYSKYWKEY